MTTSQKLSTSWARFLRHFAVVIPSSVIWSLSFTFTKGWDLPKHVYVVWSPSNRRTKVGVARNLKSRLGGIKSRYADDVILISATPRTRYADVIEEHAHGHLEDYETKIMGGYEWFRVVPLTAIGAVYLAIQGVANTMAYIVDEKREVNDPS